MNTLISTKRVSEACQAEVVEASYQKKRGPVAMSARCLLVNENVNNGAQRKGTTQPPFGADIVDLVEEMLFQRAACGIRPVLYLSSYIDLECSILMLLDDAGEARWSAEQTPAEKHVGYHIVTN